MPQSLAMQLRAQGKTITHSEALKKTRGPRLLHGSWGLAAEQWFTLHHPEHGQTGAGLGFQHHHPHPSSHLTPTPTLE